MTQVIQELAKIDESFFLFLNGFNHPFWDYFMHLFTGKTIWIPMYVSILYVLIRNYNWKTVLMCLAAIGLTIAFADQMCGSVLRPMVERLRPANLENSFAEMVHVFQGQRGAGYGFPSCHASNSFGLATIVFLIFRKRPLTIFIFCWAAINCYTRIYLGLHYPADLIVGALIGSLGAFIMYRLLLLLAKTDLRNAKHTNAIIYVGLVTLVYIIIYSIIQSAF